ncbi:hypothetical protein J2782_004395 [Brucella pseudogrignonensis]|uniref:Uncharacterized protein n=1 Tax=Brucella pseudogrignonensis TaxID=419475 RepID=A0ABU1MF34_9HYPH|nr:hypothetical protein [Brucella pseudogrignonensis]
MNKYLKAALIISAFAFLLGFTFWPHTSGGDQQDAHIKFYFNNKDL